jgi:alpha-mannosidase
MFMSFPFGGFETSEIQRRGRYSGTFRDFEKEMAYDEGDPDNYKQNLQLVDDPAKQAEWEKAWIEEHSKEKESYEMEDLQLWAIGQSHMDIAWLWRIFQIVNKAKITLGKAAWHVLNIPEFSFTFSQPLMLEWIENLHPEIFKLIEDAIKTSRFELQGGCYIESDAKIPSGESFCRQRLYGQGYYWRKFGKLAEIEWLPDSFGYNNNIPQFTSKSGGKFFYTQKISGNWPPREFPFAHFIWRSPDGSEVIAYDDNHQFRPIERWHLFGHTRRILKPKQHLICDYNYPEPKEAPELGDVYPEVGLVYGVGDGGHGPQSEEIHKFRYYIKKGYVKGFRTAKQYFTKYLEIKDRLPVWNGAELFYNLHRGTLTTQGLVKRMNRKHEWLLTGLQSLDALLYFQDPKIVHHHALLTRYWKQILLLQFHDILPGSSIPEVYDDCYDIWIKLNEALPQIANELLNHIAEQCSLCELEADTVNLSETASMLLFNPTAFDGRIPVEIELPPHLGGKFESTPKFWTADRPLGKAYLLQYYPPIDLGEPLINRPARLVGVVPLDHWTAYAYTLQPEKLEGLTAEIQEGENEFFIKTPYSEVIISRKNGTIMKYFDSNLNQPVLWAKSNRPKVFRDWSPNEPAWNIGTGYREVPFEEEEFVCTSVSIIDRGPIRISIESVYVIPESQSTIRNICHIYPAVTGIYFETFIDWRQHEAILKTYFDIASNPTHAIAEGPYTTEKFVTDPEQRTELDKERWECCAHTWVALPDPSEQWGVAVINDCKYGFDIRKNRFGLTMVRGPAYPPVAPASYANIERKHRVDGQPPTHTDQMMHFIRYAIIPYNGPWQKAGISAFAHAYNSSPLVKIYPTPEPKHIRPWKGMPVSVEPNSIEVMAAKLEENDPNKTNQIIVRIVETARESTLGTVYFHPEIEIKTIQLLDLLERPDANREITLIQERDKIIGFSTYWHPHEILTFKFEKKE